MPQCLRCRLRARESSTRGLVAGRQRVANKLAHLSSIDRWSLAMQPSVLALPPSTASFATAAVAEQRSARCARARPAAYGEQQSRPQCLPIRLTAAPTGDSRPAGRRWGQGAARAGTGPLHRGCQGGAVGAHPRGSSQASLRPRHHHARGPGTGNRRMPACNSGEVPALSCWCPSPPSRSLSPVWSITALPAPASAGTTPSRRRCRFRMPS